MSKIKKETFLIDPNKMIKFYGELDIDKETFVKEFFDLLTFSRFITNKSGESFICIKLSNKIFKNFSSIEISKFIYLITKDNNNFRFLIDNNIFIQNKFYIIGNNIKVYIDENNKESFKENNFIVNTTVIGNNIHIKKINYKDFFHNNWKKITFSKDETNLIINDIHFN